MLRFLAALPWRSALAAAHQDDRGRPVILMLHGRGMIDETPPSYESCGSMVSCRAPSR